MNTETEKDDKKASHREYMRLAVQKYAEEKADEGYFQRGAKISPDHDQMLKDYADNVGASSISETISSLISDFEDDGVVITQEHVERAVKSQSKGKNRAIGPFLKENQFKTVRGLHRTLNPRARRSMTEGLAIMIEACLDAGILQKPKNKEN